MASTPVPLTEGYLFSLNVSALSTPKPRPMTSLTVSRGAMPNFCLTLQDVFGTHPLLRFMSGSALRSSVDGGVARDEGLEGERTL